MTFKIAQDVIRPAKAEPSGAGAALLMPGRITAIVAAVVVAAIIALGLTGYIEKWLWMSQLDYVGIFWTVLSVQCAMGALAFVVVFGFL